MGKLKLLPYYHKNYDSIYKEAENTDNVAYNNRWYLHGELEYRLGYDRASIINARECPEYIKLVPEVDRLKGYENIWTGKVDSFKLIPHLYAKGIIECEVIGIEEPCIGYFWTTNELPMMITSKDGMKYEGTYWFQRGLICLKSDIEGCEYAFKKYNEKTDMI